MPIRAFSLLILAFLASTLACSAAGADLSSLTIATWNIAWLRNAPLNDAEYARCKMLSRAAREALDERHPMRWSCRNSGHYEQLARHAEAIDADVIALQEVEGIEAIERLFSPARYRAYVTGDAWIQRVGFAVKKASAEVLRFSDYAALGQAEPSRQGADLSLRLPNGRLLRLLGVHLKSACHSRLLTDETPSGSDWIEAKPPCKVLAEQVKPLEDWIDARVRESVDFVVLGDFNRRFDSDVELNASARDASGAQLTIWKEIDDDDPPGARLIRATAGREQLVLCRTRDRSTPVGERTMYIDHILFPISMQARIDLDSFKQLSLGRDRRGLSDHCPIAIRLRP